MKTIVSCKPMNAVVAAVAVLLVAAAGFCVFDTDGHDHDAVGLDLCTVIAFVTGGAFLSVVLGVIGSITERRTWDATPVALPIPDPPPWR